MITTLPKNEHVTVAELRHRFPGEWILLADPYSDPQTGQLVEGMLVFHSTNRNAMYEKAIELRLPRAASLHIALPVPDNVEFCI
jgi:hypothetical protein